MTRQFGLFLMVGGVAAGVNWLARLGLSGVLPLPAAVSAAYLIGMAVAYGLNRRFVFAASGRGVRSEVFRFAIVNVVSFTQVFVVTLALARLIFPAVGFELYPEAVAHAIGVLSPAVTSYIGHRRYSFAPQGSGLGQEKPS